MKKAMISLLLVLVLAGSSAADSPDNPEYGLTVPSGQTASANECKLGYFNLCSGWVYWWTSFNGTAWADLQTPAKVGVCFDLDDCEDGCTNCKRLGGLLWAWNRFTCYGRIDVEIYCADESSCPVGSPLAGFYDYSVNLANAFQYFPLGDVELPCDGCKFVAIATVKTPGDCAPYSDANDRNRTAACESPWRCSGHSYVYRSAVDYCTVQGSPEPLTIEYDGACDDDTFHSEFIVYAYVGCSGLLATEKNTWSELKKFYR